jgi:hypothetical protein
MPNAGYMPVSIDYFRGQPYSSLFAPLDIEQLPELETLIEFEKALVDALVPVAAL